MVLIAPGSMELLQHIAPLEISKPWLTDVKFSSEVNNWTAADAKRRASKRQTRRNAAIKRNPSLSVVDRPKLPVQMSTDFVLSNKSKPNLLEATLP